MTYTLTITNWTPPLINAVRGRHWSAEHKAKKEAAGLLWIAARQAGCPDATGPRRVSVRVTLGPGQRIRDPDACDKILLDALVRAGLLTDDDYAGVVGRMQVDYDRGPRPATVLTLEDVPT